MPSVKGARIKLLIVVLILGAVGYGGYYLYTNSTGNMFAAARTAFESQDHDTARQYLDRILSRNPDHLDALFLLAQIDMAARAYPATERELNRILALDPLNGEARRMLVKVLLAQCRFVEAQAQLETIAKSGNLTNEDKACQALAVAGLIVGSTQPEPLIQATEALLAEVGAVNANLPQARLANALCLLEKGEYQAAPEQIQAAQSMSGDSFAIHWANGKSLFFAGDLQNSLASLDRADQLRRTGQGVAPPAHWLMELYLYQGLSFVEMGQFEEAERRFNIAVENLPSAIEPTLANVNLNLIQAFTQSLVEEGQSESQRLYRLAADVLFRRQEILKSRGALEYQLALVRLYLQSYQEALSILEDLSTRQTPYVQALQELGNLYYDQANYDKAAAVYRKILTFRPDDLTAHYNLATILIRGREVELAKEHLSRVVETDETWLDAALNYGLTARLLGQYEEAEKEYQGILESIPNSMDALIGLGLIHSAREEKEKAAQFFNQAKDQHSERSEPYYYLGQLALEEGKDVEAQSMFERCLLLDPGNEYAAMSMVEIDFRKGQWEQAKERLVALNQNPNTRMKVVVGNALLLAQLKTGEVEEAEKRLRSLEEIMSGMEPEMMAAVRTNLATLAEVKGKEAEALERYRSAVDAQPQEPLTHYNLGTAHLARGNYSEAILSLRRARELDPEDEAIRYNMAVAQASVNQWKEAQTILSELAQSEEASIEVVRNLAEAYIGGGEPLQALELLQPAIERRPGAIDLKVLEVKGLVASGDYENAALKAEDLAKTYPQDGGVQMANGIALFHRGNLEQAETHFRRALQILPDDPNLKLNLATFLIARGDYEGFSEAEELLSQIEGTAFETSPDYLNQCALLAFHQSDFSSARRYLQQSLIENGNQPEIQALFKKIEQL
jgi:tetratricopeptide (TPR) repeat protein